VRSTSTPTRKTLIGAATAAALALALTVGLSTAAAARNATVTISVSALAGSQEAPLNAVASNFKKAYRNIDVKIQYYPVATYGQVLYTQFQAGNAADVVYGSPGTGNANSLLPLGTAGHLLDLSKRAWAKRVPGGSSRQLFWVGKKLYAAPVDATAVGLIYTASVFNGAGLKIPTTWSRLLSYCAQAKAKGLVGINISGANPQNTGITAIALAANDVYAKDPNWDAKRTAGKVTFAGTPGWHKTLQRIIDMKNAGCYADGAAARTTPASQQDWAAGHIAGYAGPGNAIAGLLAVAPQYQVKMFPFPADKAADTHVVLSYGNAFGVNAHSPTAVRNAALKFIDFIEREGQDRLLANKQGNPSLVQVATLQKLPSTVADMAPLFKAKRTRPLSNQFWPTAQVYANLASGVQGLLTGQSSIDDVLKSMDDVWSK
jgi:raffinose/stachyose/melibiose transport system substrate-binding protein